MYNFAASNNISMTTFDKHRLTEIILYILNKTKGLDYYHVFKILYFANIAQLAKYMVSLWCLMSSVCIEGWSSAFPPLQLY